MALPGKNLISEKEIFDYLMTKPGMTEVKAAGIVANIAKESLYYADAVQMGDVENPGIGLFQYTFKTRKDAFLKAVPDWKTNWKAQIDFAFNEPEFKAFMKEPYETVQDSTRGFMTTFEKPKDQSEEEVQDRVNRLYNSPNIKDDLKNLPKDKNIEPEDEQNILPEVNIEVDKESDKSTKAPTIGVQPVPVDKNEELNKPDLNAQFLFGNLDESGEKLPYVNLSKRGLKGTVENPFEKLVPIGEAIEDSFYKDVNGEIYHFIEGDFRPIESERYKKKFGKKLEKKLDEINKNRDRIQQIQTPEPDRRKGEYIPKSPELEQIQKNLDQERLEKERQQQLNNMEFVDVPEDDDLDDFSKPQTKTTETTDPKEDKQEKKSLTETLGGAASFADSAFTAASKVLDGIGGPGALVSYVLGKRALKDAMQEMQPQKRADLSPLFYEQYRQSKELAKQGFAPNEERAIRERIDDAYQVGLENAVRGTAGNRARFLAQSGVLDSARSSALLNFAAQDDQLRRQNQKEFTDLMMFKENFDQQRSEQQRAEDMRLQLQDKSAAGQFAAQAFSNVLSGLSGNNALLKRAFGNLQSGGLTPTSSIIN